MVAAVDTMAYANEVPWHGLGNAVSNKLTPKQMQKAAGLDWTVSKRPLFYHMNGDDTYEVVKDKYALTRDSDGALLSVVGSVYKPVQNEIALDFFKKFIEAGDMTMETAGALWGGRYVWGLARLGNDFTLGKEDEVRGFLLLSQPHAHGKAMVIQFTPIRVVCWNTLTFALGADLKGKTGAFRMPHSMEFSEKKVKTQAETALGLASGQMDSFKQAATLLTKKKAKPEAVEEYFCEVLKFDPKDNDRAKKKDGESREPRSLPMFREALTHAPGQELPTAKGTWWGALNSVSYVVDHELGRDRGTALRNAWLGHTANIKRRALDLALARAA